MTPTFEQAFKVWWSFTWRFLIGIMVCSSLISGLIILLAMLLMPFKLIYIESIISLAVLLLAFFALLFINYVVINALARIKYKNFRVQLMSDSEIVNKFNTFDAACVLWSQAWRSLFVQLLALLLIGGITFYAKGYFYLLFPIEWETLFLISIPLGIILYIVAAAAMYLLPFYWTLTTKRSGRYLLLTQRD